MSNDRNKKIVASIPGVLVILGVASLVTYGASLVVREVSKPKYTTTTKVVEVKETPKVEAPAPVAAAPAPAPAPAAPTATTKSFVRFRASRSTSSAVLAELQAGTVVTLGSYVDSKWQQATYNGQTGYIAKVYLQY